MARLIPWSESFAVGHPDLDRQHRRLVELINDIHAAAYSRRKIDRLADLLKVARVAADQHLRHESDILWQIASGAYLPLRSRLRNPGIIEAVKAAALDEHIAEHATLLDRFDAISRAPADSLSEGLKAWFVDHALGRDAHLKPLFQTG